MALAVGAVLLLIGGYQQVRSSSSAADGRQQTAAGPSSVSGRATPPASAGSAHPSPKPTRPAPPPEVRSAGRLKPGDPVRVSVPSLGISARVLRIRARDRALIPPSNPRLIGWWSEGARPGAAKGSAIITGHTVHDGGGAFDDLGELTTGDAVTVTTTGQRTLRYVVASVTVYRKKALAKQAARIFSQSGPGRLVLVTCEDWDGSAYLSNAVVIAKPTTSRGTP
ncbi:class F sortase [Kribbella sp. NBC_01245]|uniref:class F sortase n=1 Tax=Kribbella sp. NBC_01245 TaxID=2903578 RepID=UPI002E2A9D7D|nr:class F sortase [Kribbella sp. NBC_01245]